MNFSLNKIWYALKLSMRQSPFLNSWKRERRGKIPLLLLLFKKRKEGSFGCLFFYYGSLNGYGVFHNAKGVLIRRNVSVNLCGYSLFLWFPKGEKPMCRKRGNFVVKWKRVNHSSNSCFNSF